MVASHGSDAWWMLSEDELLPPRLASDAAQWRKGYDTLDVWFDSGCSWAAVLLPRTACDLQTSPGADEAKEVSSPRADLYLEGELALAS